LTFELSNIFFFTFGVPKDMIAHLEVLLFMVLLAPQIVDFLLVVGHPSFYCPVAPNLLNGPTEPA
jgi:hypothetical protein